jgi:hypothetical protein
MATVLSETERKKRYLLLRGAEVLAESAREQGKAYAPAAPLHFALNVAKRIHGLSPEEGLALLREGDQRGWSSALSAWLLARAMFVADQRGEMPDPQEIQRAVGIGATDNAKELAGRMAGEYPGTAFEAAGVALAARAASLTEREVQEVVEGYVTLMEGQYRDAGNTYLTGGYYSMAHERYDPILSAHRGTARWRLEQLIESDSPATAAAAAYLLALYGNRQSIERLREAKERHADDARCVTFIEASISVLSVR